MAIDKNKLIKVTNRFSGIVGYDVQDMPIPHRNFQPGETKEITFEELEKVAASTAGRKVLADYLIIKDYEAAKELLPDIEPEYYYTEQDVKRLLETPNNYDAFLDCLDFAPDGVIDLIKKNAVDLEIPDLVKRRYIQEKTGFNVDAAITAVHAKTGAEEDAEKEGKTIESGKNDAPKRRVATPSMNVENKPQRRVVIKKD